MKKDPNIYIDFTIMTGMYNFTLFCFRKFVFLDIRFSPQVNQIVFCNWELLFRWKGTKECRQF